MQQTLNPRGVWLFFIRAFLVLLGVAAVLALIPPVGAQIQGIIAVIPMILRLVMLLVVVVLCYVWAYLSYTTYKYELADDAFRKESGVINKKYVAIPYDRIQNIDIDRGLLSRILGLSAISVQTAGLGGAGGSEGLLPGLSVDQAQKIREELLLRAQQSRIQRSA